MSKYFYEIIVYHLTPVGTNSKGNVICRWKKGSVYKTDNLLTTLNTLNEFLVDDLYEWTNQWKYSVRMKTRKGGVLHG